MKIRAEIKFRIEKKRKKTIKQRVGSLKRSTKSTLARLTKKRLQITKIRYQRRDISIKFTEIKRIMEEYYELYVKTG